MAPKSPENNRRLGGIDPAALAVASLAAAVSVISPPGPYSPGSMLIGIAVLAVIVGYDHEPQREPRESFAFSAVCALAGWLVLGYPAEIICTAIRGIDTGTHMLEGWDAARARLEVLVNENAFQAYYGMDDLGYSQIPPAVALVDWALLVLVIYLVDRSRSEATRTKADAHVSSTDGAETRRASTVAPVEVQARVKCREGPSESAHPNLRTHEMNAASDSQSRLNYLLACFHSSQEELLTRVKQREEWIKLQLVAQVVILALANGVKLMGAEPTSRVLWVSTLALPVSVVFYLLYVVEDRLIKHLADYIGDLSSLEARINSAKDLIPNFDNSHHLKAFFRETLIYRIISQFVVFVLIPGGVALAYRWGNPPRGIVDWVLAGTDVILGFVLLVVLILTARFRFRQNKDVISTPDRRTAGHASPGISPPHG